MHWSANGRWRSSPVPRAASGGRWRCGWVPTGYRVGLIARRRERARGGRPPRSPRPAVSAVPAVADVGDRAALRAAIAEIESRLGPADVMVANAGFGAPTRLDPLNTHDVEQTIRVNILGVIYSIEAVLPGMLARKRGHLLAVSSLGAFKGLPGESAYCASKAAVNAYMEGLRIALRSKGVVGDDRLPGFRRDADDTDGFGHAVPDVGRRGRPANRSADRHGGAEAWLAFRCRCRS